MRHFGLVAAAILTLGIAACGGSTVKPIAPPGVVHAHAQAQAHAHAHARGRAGQALDAASSARPRFHWSGRHVTPAELGKTWHSGCPVGPDQLRMLTLTYWGFDHQAHTGHLVVRGRVVADVVTAFRAMYKGKFPIRRMRPVSVYDGDDNTSMRHDNTSAFNCRYAVSNGPKSWSMHAYGEAIDINTVENPYYLNGRVRPKKGEPYIDRSNVRPGMIVSGSVPLTVFTQLGWGWGGNWSSSPDYQHFSTTGG